MRLRMSGEATKLIRRISMDVFGPRCVHIGERSAQGAMLARSMAGAFSSMPSASHPEICVSVLSSPVEVP